MALPAAAEEEPDDAFDELPPLSSGGQSPSWLKQKANMMRILFESGATKGKPLDRMEATELCDRTFWGKLCTYLIDVYKSPPGTKNAGKYLRASNVLNYLRSMMHLAKGIVGAEQQAQDFFTCLDPHSSTASATWFTGLKKNVVRVTFERAVENGDTVDGSEQPLYAEHIVSISRAYAQVNTSEAAGHRLPSVLRPRPQPCCRAQAPATPLSLGSPPPATLVHRAQVLHQDPVECRRADRRGWQHGLGPASGVGRLLQVHLRDCTHAEGAPLLAAALAASIHPPPPPRNPPSPSPTFAPKRRYLERVS